MESQAVPLAKQLNQETIQPAAADFAVSFEQAAKDLCDTVGPVAEKLPQSLKNAVDKKRVPDELAVSAGFASPC